MGKYQQRGENLVMVSMKFPRDLWRRLKVRAAMDDTTVTKIFVRLSREYLARPKKKGGR